ncbi:MAG: chemotaxis protein CheW [Gemmatimonadales bacterium]
MADLAGARVVVCRVADRRFSLAVSDVREVCTGLKIVQMPGVASPVEGVANVRGSVVTVVRAADLLGVQSEASGGSPWLVVLQYRDGRVALGVDEVVDLDEPTGTIPGFEVQSELAPVFGVG